MVWMPVPDYRQEAQGYPRGEVADFFPLLPSPFTLSVLRAGWDVASRALAQRVEGTFPPGWVEAEGQLWCHPAFWEQAAAALAVDGAALAAVLGVPELRPRPAPRPGRGLLGFLRGSSGPDWQEWLREARGAHAAVQRWQRRVLAQRWTQADILQVMEEIAPFAGRVLYGYAVTTLALAHTLAPRLAKGADTLVPPSDLPSLAVLVHTDHLAEHFPWLGPQPFEAASPRWREEAPPALETCPGPSPVAEEAWHEALRAREEMRVTLALVMDAARAWVLAAAEEGLEDGRLTARGEAFWLELEELKQMMTGEWSDPRHVQDVVEQRRDAWRARAAILPPPPRKFLGDKVVVPDTFPSIDQKDALVAAAGWHPGWAVWACRARGLFTLAQSPLSYGCLLARRLGIPVVEWGNEEAHG